MDNLDNIEEQLESISTSLGDIDGSIYEYVESYNNSGPLSGIGLILIIVLICINNNIKKLTQAIKEKNKYS